MKIEVKESKFNVGDVVEYGDNKFGRVESVSYTKNQKKNGEVDDYFDYWTGEGWVKESVIKGKIVFQAKE